MRQVRTFLAIPVTDELRRGMAGLQRELTASLRGIRWVNPATIHLTLRFFGDIPEESLEKIGDVMLSVGCLCAPFQAEAAGVGAFPSPARPRVIWLGVRGGPSLAALHATMEEGLRQIGFPGEDRSFSPHLTLGRCRQRIAAAQPVLERFRDFTCGPLPVDRVILYESRLEPAGAVHLPLKTVYLGGQNLQ
jgi:2'-5' RNA ligase